MTQWRRTALATWLVAAHALAGAPPKVEAQRAGTESAPRITSVSERLIELRPDGTTSEVIIEGTGLDGFTEAVLELNGRPVSDVRIGVTHERSGRVVVRMAAAPELAGRGLQLVLVSDRDRLPVEDLTVDLLPEEDPARLLRMQLSRPSPPEGSSFDVGVSLDRPADSPGVDVSLTYPAFIDGPATVTIPAGAQSATVQATAAAVDFDEEGVIVASIGRDSRLEQAVRVVADVFEPVDLTTSGFSFSGRRFAPYTVATGALSFRGRRFSAVDIAVDAMVFEGRRFRPVAITTSEIYFKGRR